MAKKFKINVYDCGKFVETIERMVWGEAIGNFNPLFCRYKGERTLVYAEGGDISDLFRREESQLKHLFIDRCEDYSRRHDKYTQI
jgi:hypothetical protein